MSLLPEDKSTPDDSDAQQSTLKAFSAYDLPSVEALSDTFMQQQSSRSETPGSNQSRQATLRHGQGLHTKTPQNTDQPVRKPLKYTWSKQDNMSGQLDQQKN